MKVTSIYVSVILFLLVQCARKHTFESTSSRKQNANKNNASLEFVSAVVDPNCHIDGPVVSQVTNREGTVTYRDGIPLFSITSGIENSFDSKWIGYVCNMPDKYKHAGLKVIYSGKYYHAYKFIERQTAGETNLYLQLDSIRVK